MPNGANELTLEEIESILDSDKAATPAAEEPKSSPTADITATQAFAHRLKDATTKAVNEEREAIAKSFGYESFAAMQKTRENQILTDRGLDPETVSPVVEQLVQKRLAEDPRLKELDGYREQKAKEWAEKELTELNTMTDGEIKTLDDVPKDVLELWKTKGSLKAAYIELEGEKLINKMRTGIASGQSRGSTSHLSSPSSSPAPISGGKTRPFTPEEKDVYRFFNPDVSDDELNKMTKPM